MKPTLVAAEPVPMRNCWVMFGLFFVLALFLHFVVMPVWLSVYGDFNLAERIWKWRTYPSKVGLALQPVSLALLLLARQRPALRSPCVLAIFLVLMGWGYWVFRAMFTPYFGPAERIE